MTEVAILMRSLPFTMPFGSKRVNTNASTNSSSGTPCCRPSEIAMAKQFIRERKAAPFLVHVEEDLADRAVLVLAGAQVDLVAAHHRLLGVAGAPVGQAVPLAEVLGDDPLGHLLGHRLHVGGRRLLFLVVGRGVERLRELGAVAVEGDRLEHAAASETS